MADPVKIMCMGDSITWGDKGGYRGFLAKMLQDAGVDAVFVGAQNEFGNHEGYPGFSINHLIVGNRSDTWGISSEISVTLKKYTPDFLLLMVGTNDLYFSDPEVSCGQMQTLIAKCRLILPMLKILVASILPIEPGLKPWGATIPEDVRQRVPQFNQMLKDVVIKRNAAGEPIDFVDQYPVVKSLADVKEDGVHPAYELYEQIARRWLEGMQLFLPIDNINHIDRSLL